MQYNNYIGLDLNGRTTNKMVQVKQYDDEGRTLNIEILEDGKPANIPAGAVVTFRVVKPDGYSVIVSSEGDYVSYAASTVSITLKSSMLTTAGNAIADILITKNCENLSSATFTLQINPSAYRDEQISADTDLAVLQELLSLAEAAKNSEVNVENAALSANDAQKVYTDICNTFDYIDGLSDSKFISINYNENSIEAVHDIDAAIEGGGISYKWDADIGRVVAVFDGVSVLNYSIPVSAYEKMLNNYTIEMYVNIEDGCNSSLGMIAGTYWHENRSGIGMFVNTDANIGAAGSMSIHVTDSAGQPGNCIILDNKTWKNEWKHIVYTHSADHEYAYINGICVKSTGYETGDTVHDTAHGFRVGGLFGDGNFGIKGKIAYIKSYATEVTPSQVKKMYEACKSDGQSLAQMYAENIKLYANKAYTSKDIAAAAAKKSIESAEKLENLQAENVPYDNSESKVKASNVQDAIDELNVELYKILNITANLNSWTEVQKIVRAGYANKVFKIGDQLVCDHSLYGQLIWDIIGIDCDTPSDSNYTHSLAIQLHDCLNCTLLFDAPEPTNPDANRVAYGSNNWIQSAIRQWLNSRDLSWWTPQTPYDAAPSFQGGLAGFLRGIDGEFLSVIGSVKKITVNNTVTDGGGSSTNDEKFFLLSHEEVYGSGNTAYPYYSQGSSLPAAGDGDDSNRIKYLSNIATDWWLRTPNPFTSQMVRAGFSTGKITSKSAANSIGIAPACCIV